MGTGSRAHPCPAQDLVHLGPKDYIPRSSAFFFAPPENFLASSLCLPPGASQEETKREFHLHQGSLLALEFSVKGGGPTAILG